MIRANEYERRMLELINAERVAAGVPILQLEQNLNASAEAHSQWMLDTDTFSHTGVGGSSAHERMVDADFDFSGNWMSAENIAIQSGRGAAGIMDDVENLHVSLMNSPGHRANILNPNLEYIGIGIEVGLYDYGGGTFESVIVTQNFAATNGQVILDPASVEEIPVVAAPAQVVQANVVVQEEEPAEDPVVEEQPAVIAEQPTPEPVQEPAPVAELEKTSASPEPDDTPIPQTDTPTLWSEVTSGDTFAFLEDMAADLDVADVLISEGPQQDLPAFSHAIVSQHFAEFEAMLNSVQTDDLSF